jgi:hypothetical protein
MHDKIHAGYENDQFTQKLMGVVPGMTNIHHNDIFWFIDDHLVVPNSKNIHKTLFQLAHDQLRHLDSLRQTDPCAKAITGHTCSMTLRTLVNLQICFMFLPGFSSFPFSETVKPGNH